MSTQINFSDLSDVQKEAYLKYIVENDIPLKQTDSTNQGFVAKITIPKETKVINQDYEVISVKQTTSQNAQISENQKTQEVTTSQRKQSQKMTDNKENNCSSKSPIKRKDRKLRQSSEIEFKAASPLQTNKSSSNKIKQEKQSNHSPYRVFSALNTFKKNEKLSLIENSPNARKNKKLGEIQKADCNQTIAKGNILIIDPNSKSGSSSHQKQENNFLKEKNEIYQVLRSVGFSPKQLFSDGDESQPSVLGEMRSDPQELPSSVKSETKDQQQKQKVKNNSRQQSWQEQENEKIVEQINESKKEKINKSKVFDVFWRLSNKKYNKPTSKKEEKPKPNVNLTKLKDIDKYFTSSRSVSPAKKSFTLEAQTNVKMPQLQIPKQESSQQKSLERRQVSKSPSRISSQFSTSSLEQKDKQICTTQQINDKSISQQSRDKSPQPKGLYTQSILKLLKFKINRIAKIPLNQAKEIVEEIYISKTTPKKHKRSFDEFVYEFFIQKYKQNIQVAENHLINFIATLEFFETCNLATKMFLSHLNDPNDENLGLLLNTMKSIQSYIKSNSLLSIKVNEKQISKIMQKILGDISLPLFLKVMKSVAETQEYKQTEAISANDFLALIVPFLNSPEFKSISKFQSNDSYHRNSSNINDQYLYSMIDESFGVQQCNKLYQSISLSSKAQHLSQNVDQINKDLNGSNQKRMSYSNQPDNFLKSLLGEMAKLVEEFISMFELSDSQSIKKLQKLIFKKCTYLIQALHSSEQQKWFELLAIQNPNFQQKMQAETILKLYEAYSKAHEVEGKNEKNIKSLCRLILKVPEFCEATSSLLLCVIGTEDS